MKDSTDTSVESTALRETEEELGITSQSVQILGLFHDTVDKSFTISVTPVVAYIGEIDTSKIKPNASEVDSVFTLTLSQLLDVNQRAFVVINEATELKMPVFKAGPHPVWGLTALILNLVLNTTVLPATAITTDSFSNETISKLKSATELEMTKYFGWRAPK